MWKVLAGKAAVVAAAVLCACKADCVRIANDTRPNEWGILVDGTRSTGPVSDARYTSTGEVRRVGKLDAGPASNEEVIAFTNRRPVALAQNVPWTSADDDVVDVAFADEIRIPVTVWIVKGPFDAQRLLAIDHCVTTSSIWNAERMGVGFAPFEIVDATADPDAPTYYAFDCSLRTGIQNDIGFKADRINVYWVDTVDGGADRGQACTFGSNFVAMGRAANDELLVHEFGHDFDLEHVDGQATFDDTNIMDSASSMRQFITEGQLFRMHLDANSALNTTYAARAGLPIRSCVHGADSNDCPALDTRIWADGTWPAN